MIHPFVIDDQMMTALAASVFVFAFIAVIIWFEIKDAKARKQELERWEQKQRKE